MLNKKMLTDKAQLTMHLSLKSLRPAFSTQQLCATNESLRGTRGENSPSWTKT